MMYTQDYDEMLPWSVNNWGTTVPWVTWPFLIQPYTKSWEVMACPSLEKGALDYGEMHYPVCPTYAMTNALWNGAAPVAMAVVTSPSSKICMADSNHPVTGTEQGWLTSSVCGHWVCGNNVATTHKWMVPHSDGINVGYLDGHAKWRKGDQVWNEIQAGATNPAT